MYIFQSYFLIKNKQDDKGKWNTFRSWHLCLRGTLRVVEKRLAFKPLLLCIFKSYMIMENLSTNRQTDYFMGKYLSLYNLSIKMFWENIVFPLNISIHRLLRHTCLIDFSNLFASHYLRGWIIVCPSTSIQSYSLFIPFSYGMMLNISIQNYALPNSVRPIQ